jgi:hypothetical protein
MPKRPDLCLPFSYHFGAFSRCAFTFVVLRENITSGRIRRWHLVDRSYDEIKTGSGGHNAGGCRVALTGLEGAQRPGAAARRLRGAGRAGLDTLIRMAAELLAGKPPRKAVPVGELRMPASERTVWLERRT